MNRCHGLLGACLLSSPYQVVQSHHRKQPAEERTSSRGDKGDAALSSCVSISSEPNCAPGIDSLLGDGGVLGDVDDDTVESPPVLLLLPLLYFAAALLLFFSGPKRGRGVVYLGNRVVVRVFLNVRRVAESATGHVLLLLLLLL